MYGSVDMEHTFRIKTLYTAFDEEIESEYFFVGERHNFWELVVILSGQVGITAGEDAWVLEPGQAVLHGPMEFHRVWYSGSPGKILVFSFGAEGISPEAAGRYRVPELQKPLALLEELRRCFRLEGISVKGLLCQELDAQLMLKRWEVFLMELMVQKPSQRQAPKSRPAKNYATIVRVLESNVHRSLSVEEIAALCSMSPISVKQTFSRYAGMGIMNYFNRLKIQAAAPMLQKGASVQETAAALGFSSQNYFCTVFRRIMGMSPTQYKKHQT